MKKILLFACLVAILASGCSKVEPTPTPQPTPTPEGAKVYVAAQYFDGTNYVAGVWIDGERHMMETLSGKSTTAGNMFVSGSDYYMAGRVDAMACYWKNGKLTQLSNKSSQAYGVYVKDNHVIVCGTIENTAVAWIDGKQITLSTEEITIPGNITMDNDGNVYCYGTYIIFSPSRMDFGRIWKIENPFTSPTVKKVNPAVECANVYNLAFRGADTHMLLTIKEQNKEYYKNSNKVSLPTDLWMRDMFVTADGTAMFLAYTKTTSPDYYVYNATTTNKTKVVSKYKLTICESIAMCNGEAYVSGTVGSGSGSAEYVAAYWTPDGVCHELEPGSDYKSSFTTNCIVVK